MSSEYPPAQASELGAALQATFRSIQSERMADVPLLNPRLRIAWVAEQADEDATLGVLVTPWFMSLVRLPRSESDWSSLGVGDEVGRTYPSGHYRFLVNEEQGVGKFQSCSLFSPVFEFEDQAAAIDTARCVMSALFDQEHAAPGDVDTAALVARWHPEEVSEESDEATSEETRTVGQSTVTAESISCSREVPENPGRRRLLGGSVAEGVTL